MRVVVLGGAGAMGAVAVRTAVGLPGVDEMVIADRDVRAAERVAAAIADRGKPVRAQRVDVTDREELLGVLRAADVVLNLVGPYYEFGCDVLRAAIETGTHYLDVSDDRAPAPDMLELDAHARAAGVCAIIGMGANPGVGTLLAQAAARELDLVRDVYTGWSVGHSEPTRSFLSAVMVESPGTLPPLFAVATGMKQDREEVVLARLSVPLEGSGLLDDMATATGIPLALGLYQVIDGSARRPGVHPPDAVIDPELFFRDLENVLRLVTTGPAILIERRSAAETLGN